MILRILSLTFLLIFSFHVFGSEETFPKLAGLLPQQTNQVSLMRPLFLQQTKELEARLRESVREHSAWWLDYVQKHAGSGPLPFHTNLGLTEVEYKTWLGFYKTKGLTNWGSVRLECQHTYSGMIRLSSNQLPRPVLPIVIDPVTLEAQVPLARLGKAELVNIKDAAGGGVFGPYKGYLWKFEEGSFESGKFTSVQLNVLKRAADGRVFIYYFGKTMKDNELRDNFDVTIDVASTTPSLEKK